MRNFFLVVLVSALVAGVAGYSGERMANAPSTAAPTETAYDRIIKSGKIRCGYIVYPPNIIRDPNSGTISGISYDIITQLGKEMGLAIEWVEETGSASMIEGINTGRFDLLCTNIWGSTARGKVAQFTTPLYFTAINAYARKGDSRFKVGETSFNKTDLTISTVDGDIAGTIAREDAPLAKTYSLPDLTDFTHLLLAVKDKKADLTFAETTQVAGFEASNPDVLQNLTPDRPVRVFANVFMMKMGDTKLAAMLDTGIQNLRNNGFIDKVLASYAVDKAYRPVTRAYQ